MIWVETERLLLLPWWEDLDACASICAEPGGRHQLTG
jgi:hypothetical protein